MIKQLSFVVRILLIFLLLIGSIVPHAIAKQSIEETPKWPHERSDLEPDPQVVFKRLPNGFRFILMENHKPKDRVSLHLNIQAGSLHETEDQRGLAHFLEHLLFCGSEHFPPGELIKYFQSIGMDFGADANAHTGFLETVYDINLPGGDKENLEKGLLVIEDYAKGALLIPSEIDRERKVVLAEKRVRDSASYRTFVSTLKFEFPDALIPQRIPIGKKATIKEANRELLKKYYDTWYRPGKMILVMVGDFDTELAISLIEKRFASIQPRAKGKAEPDIGDINHNSTKAFYHYEKEEGETSVSIESIKKIPKNADSLKFQTEMLIKDIADQIIQDRLNIMTANPETPFTSARIGSGIHFHEVEYAEISAECSPENWQKTLAFLEQTLRKGVKYGFKQQELDKVKKELIAELDKAVKGASTRKSQMLARQLIRTLNREWVFQSPEQEREIFTPIIASLKLETVNEEFRKTWMSESKLFLVTGNAEIKGAYPQNQILKVAEQSMKKEVSPPEERNIVTFPYLPEPRGKGKIIKRADISDVGIIQIDFENNFRLNIKKTDFKANEVLLTASFGTGRSGEPMDKPGLSRLASSIVNESGTGKLTKEDLKWALAGKNTALRFSVRDEGFLFKGKSVSKEISVLFQLLYTYITDSAYREDAYELSMERFKQKYEMFSHTIEGAMELTGDRFLAGGDMRFGFPSFELFSKNSLEDVRKWVDTALSQEEMEVSIIGDIDIELVIEMASKYLGTLPSREKSISKENLRQVHFPESKSINIAVPTKIPKGLIEVAYPTEDFWDIKRTRRLLVLGEVFSEKLRIRIREKLGASYSPYAYNQSSKAYTGYGLFHAVVQVSPESADMVIKEVKEISSELSRNGVNEEALRLSLDPVLTHIKDLIKTNRFWLRSIMTGSKKHPEQLDWSRTIMQDYASISKEDISKLAKKYLNNDKAATIIIQPIENQ